MQSQHTKIIQFGKKKCQKLNFGCKNRTVLNYTWKIEETQEFNTGRKVLKDK